MGFVVGVYDARRRRAQRGFNRERRRTEVLNQSLRVLNRLLRHDIRNDMNVILGYADLIDDGEEVEAIKSQAQETAELSERAREIEEALRKEEVRSRVVDVVELVENVERSWRGEADVIVESPSSVWVEADESLEVAIDNLVENAVVHADGKRDLIVKIRVVEEDDYVEVRVSDNGPGIPREEVRLLEEGVETELVHSSGVGLWMVRWIMEGVDGELSFGDKDREGTTVVLRLQAEEGERR